MTWEECMETLGVNDWYGCKMGLQPTRNLLKKCGNPENTEKVPSRKACNRF